MAKTTTSVTSHSDSATSPISVEFLRDLIDNNQGSDDLINVILNSLQKKSSKHKFLIQSTLMVAPDALDRDLNISTNFGAIWDSENDGYITIKLDSDDGSEINSTLLTVYWIYTN